MHTILIFLNAPLSFNSLPTLPFAALNFRPWFSTEARSEGFSYDHQKDTQRRACGPGFDGCWLWSGDEKRDEKPMETTKSPGKNEHSQKKLGKMEPESFRFVFPIFQRGTFQFCCYFRMIFWEVQILTTVGIRESQAWFWMRVDREVSSMELTLISWMYDVCILNENSMQGC